MDYKKLQTNYKNFKVSYMKIFYYFDIFYITQVNLLHVFARVLFVFWVHIIENCYYYKY